MKSKNKIKVLLFFAVIFCTIYINYLYAQEYSIIQLSDNGQDNTSPRINNGQVVWGTSDGKVLLYNGSNTVELTNTARRDYLGGGPEISNGQVVWVDGSGQVFLWDGVTTRQISNNSGICEDPKISNGQVVWKVEEGGSGSNRYTIFYYNGTRVIELANNVYAPYPQINNGQAVWTDRTSTGLEVFLYDGSKIIQLENSNSHWNIFPQIHNGQILWTGWDGHDYEVFLYNGIEVIQLTNNDFDDGAGMINNGHAVWSGDDGHDYEIYLYDGTSTFKLTDNEYRDVGPKIHNGQVGAKIGDGVNLITLLTKGGTTRMRKLTLIILTMLFLFTVNCTLLAVNSFAAEPPRRLINYQGRLTDSQGVPLNDSYNVTFRIYDAEHTWHRRPI